LRLYLTDSSIIS